MDSIDLVMHIRPDGTAAVRTLDDVDRRVGDIDGTTRAARRELSQMERTLVNVGRGMLAAFSVAAVVNWMKEITRASDQLALMDARARKLSGGSAGFRQMYDQAQALGVSLTSASEALSFFAPGLGKLGVGFQSAANFAANLTRAMRVYGVEGAQAASVTTQLAQAMASDTLAGDELKSLRENAGGLAIALERAIQQSLGTTKSLKDLGAEGELSARVVYEAFNRVFNEMRSDMESLPTTLEQQEARFDNAAGRLMAALDHQLHISDWWKGVTGGWAEAMDTLAARLEAPTTLGNFGQWSDEMAALDDRIARANVDSAALAKTMESTSKSAAQIATARERYAELQEEIRRATAQKRIYLQMAAEDREVELGAAAASQAAAAGLGQISKEAQVAANILGEYLGKNVSASAQRLNELWSVFDEAEQKVGISKEVVIAVAAIESSFNAAAQSSAGAKGMLQFIDSTAAGVAERMRDAGVATYSMAQIQTDANAAIMAGAFHLQELIDKYGNLTDALIAYNAGPGKVGLPFEQLPQETQDYVTKALPAIKALTRGLGDAGDVAKLFGKNTAGAFKEVGATEPSLRSLADTVQDLADAYLPAERNARQYAQTQATLAAAVATGTVSQERANQILAAAEKQLMATGEKIPTVSTLWTESVLELERSMQRTFGDAFTDLLSGTVRTAADFMDRLKDVVLSALGDLAAALLMRPLTVLINGVLGTTTAVASDGSGASATGVTGASGGSGIWGSLGSLSNLTTGTGIGETLGAGYSYIGADTVASGVSVIPNWAFGAGSILGGIAGTMLFDGEYVSIGSSIGATIGAAAGASMAAYFAAAGSVFGPIGTVVGGILGGVAGGWLSTAFGGNDTVAAWVDMQGGQFKGVKAENLSESQIEQMLAVIDQYNALISDTAAILGPTAQEIMAGWGRTGGPQGLDPEQFDDWLKASASGLIEAMVQWTPGLFGEAVQELWDQSGGDMATFASGIEQLKAFYDQLPAYVASLTEAGINLGEDAERTAVLLMNAAGGYDNLIAAHANYLDLVLTDDQKLAQGTELLQGAFGQLGLTLPTTRDGLQELMASLDPATEAGRTAMIAIYGMVDVLGQYITAQEAAAEATATAVSALEALVYSSDALSRLEMGRSASDAATIGADALGIDITTLDRDGFAAAIEGLGGIDAVVSMLGEDAQTWIDAVSRYYELHDQFASAAATAAAALEQVIYSQEELTALEMQRAAAEADAISMQLWGIEVSEMTRAEFAAWVESMGGIQAVMESLGDGAAAFVQSISTYFDDLDAATAAAAEASTYTGGGRYGASLAGLTDAIGQWLPTDTSTSRTVPDSIATWLADTRSSAAALDQAQSWDVLETIFMRTAVAASGNDQDALNRLTSDADAAIQAARVTSRDRVEYQRMVGQITAVVEASAKGEDPTKIIAQATKKTADLLADWDVNGMPTGA